MSFNFGGKANNWAGMVVDSLAKFNNPAYLRGLSNTESIMIDGLVLIIKIGVFCLRELRVNIKSS